MKKYTVIGQNVYIVTQTPHNEKVLYCIGINVENAIEIAAILNTVAHFNLITTENEAPEPTTIY